MAERFEATVIEAWVEAGWLRLQDDAGVDRSHISECDLARARLIHSLREELGVNDEGVGVALGLLDQLHGMRYALRRMAAAARSLPEPMRAQLLDALRRIES